MTVTLAPEGTMTELVKAELDGSMSMRSFRHENGGVTVIHYEEYAGEHDPRDNGETYAHLVSESDNYLPIDEGDHDIELMRDRCADLLGRGAGTTVWSRPTGGWRLAFDKEAERRYLIIELEVSYGGGITHQEDDLDLDDFFDSFIAASFFLGHTAEEAVRHYVEQARPDIAYYHHEWSINGATQSDWREGWAYVTWEDVRRAGFEDIDLHAGKVIFEGELKEYRAWFAGEVYRAVHIAPAGQEYAIGDEGGYYTGETLGTTERCGGLIGYDDLAQICEQFTDSPVVEEEWV